MLRPVDQRKIAYIPNLLMKKPHQLNAALGNKEHITDCAHGLQGKYAIQLLN
jgi:hypothetical protein